jgi:transketolase
VSVCVEAEAMLAARGLSTRVVSMPCWEIFDALPAETRNAVLDPDVPTVSLEAGTTLGWDRYADATIGIDRFGASAPGDIVLDRLGINAEHVTSVAVELLDSIDDR